ncbi:hypothetical protein P3T40_005765 [Paraburkholderia sp. EB58]
MTGTQAHEPPVRMARSELTRALERGCEVTPGKAATGAITLIAENVIG